MVTTMVPPGTATWTFAPGAPAANDRGNSRSPLTALAPPISLHGLDKRFGGVQALRNVSLEVARGEVLGIIGRSGAGKSTLIRCLNGLERPDRGRVEIEGRDIAQLNESALQPVRRRIGMVFQHFNLLASRTAAQNVALPLKIAGEARVARSRRARELLDLVGLADKADAYPSQLSGGQKQRVGIARALVADPVLLLGDEATSALDPDTSLSILELLRDINRRFGLTVVLITHEMSVVRRIADRVAVLEDGAVVEIGPVWQVLSKPQAEATRRLLQSLRPRLPDQLALHLRPGARPGADSVVRVDLHGAQARRPLLAELSAALGVPVTLLHGGIDHVQGEPTGSLFIGIPGQNGDLDRRLGAVLADRATTYEVLGHVAAST